MATDTAIILAAGRGSRLENLTEECPKCLVKLQGKPLIDYQIAALRGGGVSRVTAVTGYMREMIEPYVDKTYTNTEWQSTNMVASLLCARPHITSPVIISYSDIVYDSGLIRRLASRTEDIVITCDRDWLTLWAARFDNPLDDAESFKMDDEGRVLEIGQKAHDQAEIQAQYMGLIRLTPAAFDCIEAYCSSPGVNRDTLDFTGLLNGLIGSGTNVHTELTSGNWCEVDDQRDLAVAERLIADGLLNLDL